MYRENSKCSCYSDFIIYRVVEICNYLLFHNAFLFCNKHFQQQWTLKSMYLKNKQKKTKKTLNEYWRKKKKEKCSQGRLVKNEGSKIRNEKKSSKSISSGKSPTESRLLHDATGESWRLSAASELSSAEERKLSSYSCTRQSLINSHLRIYSYECQAFLTLCAEEFQEFKGKFLKKSHGSRPRTAHRLGV